MEQFALYTATFFSGWMAGFLTLAAVALWEGKKKLQPVKVDRTNVRDLYPGDRN